MGSTREIKVFHLDGRHILNLGAYTEQDDMQDWFEQMKDELSGARARLRVAQMFQSIAPIEAMTLLPSRRELICLSIHNEVTVRLVEDGDVLRSASLQDSTTPAKKRTILVCGDNVWIGLGARLLILDAKTLQVMRRLGHHSDEILGMETCFVRLSGLRSLSHYFSVDMLPVPSQGEVWVLDRTGSLLVWPTAILSSETVPGRLTVNEDKLTSIHRVGTDFWAGSESGRIYVISPASKKVVRVLEQHNRVPITVVCGWNHTVWCADGSGVISTWS